MGPSSSALLITFPRFPRVKMVFRLRRDGLEKKRVANRCQGPPCGESGHPVHAHVRILPPPVPAPNTSQEGVQMGWRRPSQAACKPPSHAGPAPSERISFLPVSSTPIRSSFSATSSYCRFRRQKTGPSLAQRDHGARGRGRPESGGEETRPPAQGAHLELHQAVGVGLEVAEVDLAHGIHVLIPHLLGDDSLMAQQELVEKPAPQKRRSFTCPPPRKRGGGVPICCP